MKKKWDERKISLGNAIIVAAALAIVGFIIGLNFTNGWGQIAPYFGFKNTSSIDWSPLNEVYETVAASYNGEIDNAKMIEGAKAGMIDALGDIYTTYLDATAAKEFQDSLNGKVGSGIGVEIGLRDGYVRVLRTLPDNPARAAGMLAGDIIYKIDGEEVYMLSTEEISSKLRGETGSEVTVIVARDGAELSFTMTRETINNVSAYVEYDGATAIVTVTRFDSDTGLIVQQFAKDFASKGINKVILDLRGNGGGYTSSAQDLLGLWLDGDTAYVQKSVHFGNSVLKAASGHAILKDMKTVVLVNGSTASASEIVAGALQDYGKATIVGETTYGKGVVQKLYNLSNATVLKVTIADWHTPLDRSINKTGITPDVEVKRTYEDINAMRDPQLDQAKAI